jgi:hypothetical protein
VMRRPWPVFAEEKVMEDVRVLAVSISADGEDVMTPRVCGREPGWKVGGAEG